MEKIALNKNSFFTQIFLDSFSLQGYTLLTKIESSNQTKRHLYYNEQTKFTIIFNSTKWEDELIFIDLKKIVKAKALIKEYKESGEETIAKIANTLTELLDSPKSFLTITL